MAKLTKTIVEAAERRPRQYTVWCGQLKGFGVMINPAGSRSYVVDYTTAEGIRRRMTIGRHGALTTEEARKLAIKTLGEAVQGDDPQLERRTRRKSLTVSELCDQYLTAAKKGLVLGRRGLPKKASTLLTDEGRIRAHIKPLLGKKLVIDLKRADVQRFIRDVQVGKTARKADSSGKLRGRINVTGGAGTAARTAGLLGGILSYAASEGVIETNPATGVKMPAGKRKDRRLDPDEYKALGRTLDQAVAEGKSWLGPGIIRLAALTGCRLGEVEKLKWSEVDLVNQVMRLEDSKTGRSIRPLGKAAVQALEALPREDGEAYVFPAPRLDRQAFAGAKRSYRGIFQSAKLDGVTPHVLRHSFASIGADLGFTDSTIGACLGHAGQGITSRYTHRLDSVLIAAADKIAAEVQRQMKGA